MGDEGMSVSAPVALQKGVSGEIMTDVGKRLLVDMEIDTVHAP